MAPSSGGTSGTIRAMRRLASSAKAAHVPLAAMMVSRRRAALMNDGEAPARKGRAGRIQVPLLPGSSTLSAAAAIASYTPSVPPRPKREAMVA